MWRVLLFVPIVFFSCSKSSEKTEKDGNTLFKRLSSDETGIVFENKLSLNEDFDVFRYRNYYNGGGVAIGDINNDGLTDVYLTANLGENRLFLNNGNWKFEEITKTAGVGGTKAWSTGVAMADVNGDGLLDIYVCNSGDIKGDNKENELFINNGDLTFTDKAKEFGLADQGFSTHAAFFDYDKDGDLDCYLLNNSFRPISTLGYRNLRNTRDSLGGHKLFRNDDGKYEDVSEAAGIYGSVIGFGLGISIGDINRDNYPDLYISNDFYERDYLYVNNQDGTFSDRLTENMNHISMFSMGADVADINNDGYVDIFSTDMLPEDDKRLKTMTAYESYDVYQLRLRNDYYHQYMRNMLHLNKGDGTFTEIGQIAGVAATDWSWGALITDFNNDRRKEIFVCNGIYKDVIDQDFLEFMGTDVNIKKAMAGEEIDFTAFVDKMSSTKLSNYMYTPSKDFTYKNVALEWGLSEPSFSNGAAYGDLDNDGDLDLIVNNVNQELFVYRNDADKILNNNFLSLEFRGDKSNFYGLGAQVEIFCKGEIIYVENMPIRGFQSSMDYKMVVGLGDTKTIDSMRITWPNDMRQLLTDVETNKNIKLDIKNAYIPFKKILNNSKYLVEDFEPNGVDFIHKENEFNDFDKDRLLYYMMSTEGPALAVKDLNNDNLDDFYIGGAKEQAGAIFIQTASGDFNKISTNAFELDSVFEDIDAVFFDADSDGDQDLYVVSGGSEFDPYDLHLQDRLYLNTSSKGAIVFERSKDALPRITQNGSCVRPFDFDKDGDLDLFVGTRGIPRYYGMPADQFILENDGKGKFKDVTKVIAPGLAKLGMVTDASWADIDNDGLTDLVMVGDWMPLTVYKNDGKTFKKLENLPGLENTEGWWNCLKAADLDKDGDIDFIGGNHGFNSKFKTSPDSTLSLYVSDFDNNSSVEAIYAFNQNGKDYPIIAKQDLVKQLPSLKKQLLYYRDYPGKAMTDVFNTEQLEKALVLRASSLATTVFINEGSKGFSALNLPLEAQLSPVYGIEVTDLNHDQISDIILGGNLYSVKPEAGRYDALKGLILTGDGKGGFKSNSSQQSGLNVPGETRDIKFISGKGSNYILFARSNQSLKFYKIK
ncbi:MAG TPA: VCBS repeat-containing protein [Cytophagales bacterium]|nr:VCBS repeat-containing protein [Cytophagales bacterium]